MSTMCISFLPISPPMMVDFVRNLLIQVADWLHDHVIPHTVCNASLNWLCKTQYCFVKTTYYIWFIQIPWRYNLASGTFLVQRKLHYSWNVLQDVIFHWFKKFAKKQPSRVGKFMFPPSAPGGDLVMVAQVSQDWQVNVPEDTGGNSLPWKERPFGPKKESSSSKQLYTLFPGVMFVFRESTYSHVQTVYI